jgi:hypothetical protein
MVNQNSRAIGKGRLPNRRKVTATAALMLDRDPRILARPAIGNPKATTYGRRWQARRVQVLYNMTTGGSVLCRFSDLINNTFTTGGATTDTPLANIYASTTPIKVLGVKVWNRALGTDIKADLDGDVITVGSSSQSVVCTDTGTGTSLAGVTFRVPQVLSQTLDLGNTATTPYLTVSQFNVAATAAAPFRFLVELTLLMQI